MSRVVVTLTCLPNRLSDSSPEGIQSTIKSLISQSHENYEIHMNIPHINKFTKVPYLIPDWLKEINKVQIYRMRDIGPATKLVPTVERLTDPEDIIIVVDDDLVYHPDLVKEQVENQKKWKEAIVGYDGLRSRDENGGVAHHFGSVRDYYYTSNYRDSRVDILQHYKSVSYKRGYFEHDFFQFVKENHSWNDDLLMAAYFSYKKRDRIVTYHPSDKKLETKEEWDAEGGVLSFPVLRHTHHDFDGCGKLRMDGVDDNHPSLYQHIDRGYKHLNKKEE